MQLVWDFVASQEAQSITLKPGKYKFECWGARGGARGTPFESGFYYGNGGYSCGELILKKEITLYLYVGLDGARGTAFNGGGYSSSASGGGATDIRLVGGTWDNEQGLLSRIIVAGGGGGTGDTNKGGDGGGLNGGIGRGWNGDPAHGGTQYEGGKGKLDDGSLDGSFGKGSKPTNVSNYSGGGGGWFGGSRANFSTSGSGGGSGYALTKDSYKPKGYIPTSEYYLDNVIMTTGGNTTVVNTYSDGRAKITLLQALPFLTVSSYNSTTATFKADHTDPTLLTKIEYFIDDVLKETITTDLTTEKIVNYTLEDNALHTLKIVVTDSANVTVEKVITISRGVVPLPIGSTTEDVTNKWMEIKDTFKTGKTSIINALALKNVPVTLDNTLVEFSEKIKTFFDSSDANLGELQNQLTNVNNIITQLNSQFKVADGTSVAQNNDGTKIAYEYKGSTTVKFGGWLKISGLAFKPNIFVADCEYYDSNNRVNYKFLTFACSGFATSGGKDFVAVSVYKRSSSSDRYIADGFLYSNNEGDVWFNTNGVQVPAYVPGGSGSFTYTWRAVKFMKD